MTDWKISEEQLLELNGFLARHDDMISPNLRTRTAQESKLFPMTPYVMMSFLNFYYTMPDLLRKIEMSISPEELGHRARNSTTQLNTLTILMQLVNYLQGRVELIRLGAIRPEDNLEDLWYVCRFYRRVMGGYRRNDGHEFASEAGDISLTHDERVLQVFEADAFEVDDDLRASATRFLAVASQYSFLVFCESRVGMASSGPYSLGGQRLMHTRDFCNLSESGLPWMDEIGLSIPFNNLTAVVITDHTRVEITDFASAYTTPENYQSNIRGFGLYTSDFLTDRYQPVGMGSRKELTRTLDDLSELIKAAITPLYQRFAGMGHDGMIEAGIVAYGYAVSDMAFMGGSYEQSDWEMIDNRVRRLWPIFNEEYATAALVSDFAVLDGKAGSASDYFVHPYSYRQWRPASGQSLPHAGRVAQLVPAHILSDHDYSRRVNEGGSPSLSRVDLPRKTGKYTVLSGRLTQDEINAAAKQYSSPLIDGAWRNIDDATVKFGWQDDDVNALYRYVQDSSRLLKGQGAKLLRPDIDALRRAAGERPWSAVSE